jgi:carbamate kinase
LARNINADLFVISTAVEKVYLNFNKPNQKELDKITLSEAKKFIKEGHFAPGSMLLKINAAINFLEDGNDGSRKVILTNPENISRAIQGETGTRIIKD